MLFNQLCHLLEIGFLLAPECHLFLHDVSTRMLVSPSWRMSVASTATPADEFGAEWALIVSSTQLVTRALLVSVHSGGRQGTQVRPLYHSVNRAAIWVLWRFSGLWGRQPAQRIRLMLPATARRTPSLILQTRLWMTGQPANRQAYAVIAHGSRRHHSESNRDPKNSSLETDQFKP